MAAQRQGSAPAVRSRHEDDRNALDAESTTAADLTNRLGGKRAGDGYVACCPAHDDHTPSLSISEASDGPPLVHCHAGCDQLAVIGALRARGLWPGKENQSRIYHPSLGEPDTLWKYGDGNGRLLGYVCRWETPQGKDIRPYVSGRWQHFPKPRPLYGLDRLARRCDIPAIVCEGEKATEAAQRLIGDNYVCVTWPGGTHAVKHADWSPLRDRIVYLWPDADGPGCEAADEIARHVAVTGVVEVPVNVAKGWDAADAESEGITRAEVEAWIKPQFNEGSSSKTEGKHQGKEDTRKSAATKLVEIAEESYRFGVSTNGETFAVPRSRAKVIATLRGSQNSLRGQIARTYFRRDGRAAPQQALADALLAIDGMAQEAEPEELHLRVAQAHGAHWLDLGDNTGRAVKVTAAGWEIVNPPPVLFKRTALTSALPEPETGGSLEELWQTLNIAADDRPLVAAWVVAALHVGIAHPVLALFGEQGTGKTTAARHVITTIDASPVPTRKPPRDADSWVTAAAGSWIVGLDNLSTVPDWLSDSICRAVTGDGDVRRKLYTDGEHQVFAFRRCVIVNGIDLGGTRGDLSERMLPVNLEQIPESARRGDNELSDDWAAAHPRILGAILDLAAGVAGRLPSVRLESKPRMADFARILAAVDEVLGTEGLSHYVGKQRSLASDSLTADPFIQAMEANLTAVFKGTAGELLDRLDTSHPPKGWPTQPRQVTQRLRRQAPSMRKAGWLVTDDGGANHEKVTRWTIAPPEIASESPPPDPQTGRRGEAAGDNAAGQSHQGPAEAPFTTRAMTGCARHAGHAGPDYAESQGGRGNREVFET